VLRNLCAFFAAMPQKTGLSATIQAAWASNDFASQNRDQPGCMGEQ
jgi:hypothetical protein